MAQSIDRELNRNRQRRARQRIERAFGIRYEPAKETPAQKARRLERGRYAKDARASYDELKRAILAEGGLRANADYKREDIPPDLYRPRTGKPVDLMATLLSEAGGLGNFHYSDELLQEAHKRRSSAREAASRVPRTPGRSSEVVCFDFERDARGRFVRLRRGR